MWEPIAHGPLAVRVRTAIDDIARELEAHTAPAGDLLLAWTYLGRDVPPAVIAAFTDALLRFDRPALHEGLAGAGFALAHAGDDPELLAVIDDKLLAAIPRCPAFDVISGLAGIGVYFLERDHMPGMAAVTVELAARRTGDVWLSTPDLISPYERDAWPDGVYDCGVAHGIPGVVGVLARMAARGVPAAATVCEAGRRWLAAQGKLPATFHGDRREPARTAWCYGEPGTTAALGGRAWIDEPIGVTDAGLCHGAAGLAHVANRLYQATRAPVYRDAALTWTERALALPIDQTGERRVGILAGLAGVALALQATIDDVEPAWDRMLVCDLPVVVHEPHAGP